MRRQDIVLLGLTLGAMVLGIFCPFLAEPMRWIPKTTMLCMMFMSFLTVDARAVWANVRHYPLAILLVIVLKLIAMPMVCWFLFQWIFPRYALGAAVVGGCATAVAAPFFAFFVQADHLLVLVSLVGTSLLLPFILPAVLAFLGGYAGVEGGIIINLPVLDMMGSLAVMTGGPFIASQVARRNKRLAERIFSFKQQFFLLAVSASNTAIFSQYSEVLLQSPGTMLSALGASFLVFAVLFTLPAVLLVKLPPDKHLAFVISCAAINNVLALITCVEFFSINEVLLAAMYTVPSIVALVFYRLLGRLRGQVLS